MWCDKSSSLLTTLSWPLLLLNLAATQVLLPSQITISHRKPIVATATCGEISGQPIKEMFCSLTGSSQYTPINSYSYQEGVDELGLLQELRNPREAFIQGGHGCGHCQAGTVNSHSASNMVDGNNSWWMSPPLSRGLQYNQVNITIDLEQEFHVAYVWIQMANSPRPGTWVLERSTDHGQTYLPWFKFAENSAECMRKFGMESLSPISDDDSVVCRTDMASLQPLENAEMVIRILEHRPSSLQFATSEALQNFTKATNIRLRLLGTRTLQGHLMDMNEWRDPTVTRRYFYAIKEIMIGGRCVCNGHAVTCDILDPRRPRALLCRCEHNTCGDMCERCCPGFEQKKWQPTTAHNNFTCEPCNCFGRSNECVYDEDIANNHQSLDIHGNYEGGGKCFNCRFNTEGINCNKCSYGYFRPEGTPWNETMPCKPCICNPDKHTGACAESTGKCECQARFEGEDCDRCASGYYDPPECKPCECNVNGTVGDICLPENGQCPCKEGFGGTFCETCSPGFTNITAGCVGCVCDEKGSASNNCSAETGQCECHAAFDGLSCDKCKNGYYDHPDCKFCNCDPKGTDGGVCDEKTGQCLCMEGFAGEKCDHCDIGFYGYPDCKQCGCDGAGSTSPECDATSGQCPCNGNFTGRICDKCSAGFYDYPQCKACLCLNEGAKGQTCDNNGQCYCKEHFEGERCDRCQPNFYNYPVCEECNCNPSGVTPDFGGCDKVAPGELCSCRKHVTGRICDQCKPTFWDLQYHHTEGCIECDCNLNGTLSRLNTCNQKSGQCVCKKNAAGRRCEQCTEGYYNLKNYNQQGCEPCKCNIGGSLRADCDINTGQCKCRPRVTGLNCDKPIDNHYFPILWHNQYEAEDGHTEDQRPVRFAVDAALFPDYSWRGYAVFSPIQEKIFIDIDVAKASVYQLIFRFVNPTSVPITATIAATPRFASQAQDSEQSVKVTFPPSAQPALKEITVDGKPFVLNPGKWTVSIATKQRLFLDYIVVLPAEYYEGHALRERPPTPCLANGTKTSTCVDLLYPPIPNAARVDVETDLGNFNYVNPDGTTSPLEAVPIEILPSEVTGPAAFVRSDDTGRIVEAKIEVPEDAEYATIIEYHNLEKTATPVVVDIAQDGEVRLNGSVVIHHCPYATFCRELVTNDGQISYAPLKKGQAVVQLHVAPNHEFGLAAVNLIKKADFNPNYLQQVPVCIRKDGRCMPQLYPPAADSTVTEAESSTNEPRAIAGDKLPFPVAGAAGVKVVPLDDTQSTVEISGVVPTKGHYMFLVHYFNPDNTPIDVNVLVQNDHYLPDEKYRPNFFFNATAPLAYCPSVSGCRVLIRDKVKPEVIQYWMIDKYTVTMYYNASQKGPIYIDSVTAVPFGSFSEKLMSPLPLDGSAEFIKQCGDSLFHNSPKNVSDFCRDKIFAITTDFNSAALSCDCVAQGSESFNCEEYGGQCKCKTNVIGRRCERCAPGFYNFPECIKCQCAAGQQCDERSGQCFCPPHVEGTSCDRCVGYAYGYDPLIGCQKCGCQPQGSEGGNLVCDAESGQCLCRESVGGRQCDRCLAGFYSFPQCYPCTCERSGTTEDVCDATNAQCKCKENVYGARCEACKSGTFDLSAENPSGCINCYCFGVTDSCRSSMFYVSFISVDMSAFLTTDDSGIVDNKDDVVVYSSDTTSPASVYFIVPLTPGKDYTNSYGLVLMFKMLVTPRADVKRVMSSEPDVRITGAGNRTIEFWAPEQPSNPEEEFTVRCRLVPENFLTSEGKPVTREELMIVLHSLTNITLKASYVEYPKSASLTEFGLEVSAEDSAPSAIRASSVEQCQCPAPYMGLSCQLCAPGYHRVESGNVLGACVPCECNSHSGTCDPDTGICKDCEHNTHGDHCEFCDVGHYGDATQGSPYDCLACSCPFAPTNNFALSCVVSEEGVLQQCTCKPGYDGERCDRCAAGHFGQPSQVGGDCQPCQCNGNNNLTDSRACHPLTGDCHMCERDTAGRHCEFCAPWFHGDAIVAKNCSTCECNQCGSMQCDNRVGACSCKPNVDGDNCDRCKPDFFGFSKCRGCEGCHCGLASSNTQCNAESGQCPCRPGSAGLRCEHCEHGYWNYGEHGCDKCDCESDLSMGTVCDVRTGQCHCQEGATGSRCDQCLPSYLRIPTLGCRRCDECVHHLIRDVDNLGVHIEVLNMSIGNISSATVVGARLARINKVLYDHQQLEKLMSNAENDYGNLLGDAQSALNNRTYLFNLGNRTRNIGNLSSKRAKNLTNEADAALRDIRERAKLAQASVESLRQISASIGSHSKAIVMDPRFLRDAEETLRSLEAASADVYPEKATTVPKKLEDIVEKVGAALEKIKGQREKLGTEKNKTDNLAEYLNSAQQLLKESKRKGDKAIEVANSVSLSKLESLVTAIQDEIEKNTEEENSFTTANIALRNETEVMRDLTEIVGNSIETVNETRAEFTETLDARREKREAAVDQEAVRVRAGELATQAAELDTAFAKARTESEAAVEAANAYEDLAKALQTAHEKATSAVELLKDDKTAENMDERVQKVLDASADLVRRASELRQGALNALDEESAKVTKSLKQLSDQVEKLRKTRDNVKSTLKNSANGTTYIDIDVKVEQVNTLKKEIEEALGEIKTRIADVAGKAEQVAENASNAAQGVKITRSNVKQLKTLAPQVAESFRKLKEASALRTAKVESVTEKVARIKELVAVARDAANKIKLGVHFERGSSLNLNLPHRISRSAAHTDLSFYFKTKEDNGLPLFFGNEENASGNRAIPTDDYVAVEIEHGTPKVTLDLGDQPLVVKLKTRVSDGLWRRISIERIGKTINVTLSKPNSEETEETQVGVASGYKSVLNLHHKISRLFVGGIPSASKISSDVRNREFIGDVDDLKLHGEPIGLWNVREGGAVNVNGAAKRHKFSGIKEETSISLDGEGYTVFKPDHWNPRKTTKVSLSFLTFSPDGLLFLVGKDRDFMSLELSGGAVKLSVDFGSGVGHWTIETENYSDGKWHSVNVVREEKHVKIEVDGSIAEGDSPGEQTEMRVTEYFYIGGIPSGVSVRTPIIPFRGCIKSVRLGSDEVELENSHASKGVRSTCSMATVRTASMLSERASAVFSNVTGAEDLAVTLKFKTRVPVGSLISVVAEGENALSLSLQAGVLTAKAGDDKVSLELASAADEKWHYVSVRRSKSALRLDADDLFSNEAYRAEANGDIDGAMTIMFGRLDDAPSFVGCVGDVTYNGQLLDFAKSETKEVSLNGCSLKDDDDQPAATTTPPPVTEVASTEASDTKPATTTEEPTEAPAEIRPDDACALPLQAFGEFADADGTNFGSQPNSRLEYAVLPESLDKSGTFTLRARPTAFSGVFFIAVNDKRTDHIALLLDHGRVVFSFDAGSGQTLLRTKHSIVDNRWHIIKVSRRGPSAHLIVDDESVEATSKHNAETVDTAAPLYVGGVPSDLASYIRTLVPNVRAQLGGCIRDLKINGKALEGPKAFGTAPCATFVEDGLYFGPDGGYALVKETYEVGPTFAAELEVRPRAPDGILMSVGVLEYLNVQFVNGSVMFTVDSGGGIEEAVFDAPASNSLCDGHWHNIKLMKKKNLLTLTVNGKSILRIMKKSANSDIATKDPLYLGGVPSTVSNSGLHTRDGFKGCVRFVSFGFKNKEKKLRRKKQVDVASFNVFGDVDKQQCPVN